MAKTVRHWRIKGFEWLSNLSGAQLYAVATVVLQWKGSSKMVDLVFLACPASPCTGNMLCSPMSLSCKCAEGLTHFPPSL